MATIDLDGPKSLEDSGAVPTTRMESAEATRSRISRLIHADAEGRSQRRALVKGLVDGNPPYKAAALRKAARSDACNVNWRIAEAYLASAIGAFYDLYNEAPTYATIQLEGTNSYQSEDWSGIVTEEFHRLMKEDRSWDYTVQTSLHDMVLYGVGPLVFTDHYDWRCKAVPAKDLLVPDRATADITTWEEAVVLCSYLPHQLYRYIVHESAASQEGWNVAATREAIISAHPKSQSGGQYRHWEWHQDQLKTRSYAYSADSNMIDVAHYFIREFPDEEHPEGAITQLIVLSPESNAEAQEQYLYKMPKRYSSWEQFMHPMYYDNMGGGLHHAVTGMGVKMYSGMDFQNRLLCNLADKSFAPKILLRPTSGQADQALSIVKLGDYGKVPAGFEALQLPVGSFIEEGLMMNREIGQTIAANLSSYRQNLQKMEGNPLTATEVQQKASEQARLGKTQLNRYYNQLDWLYSEKYRRAVHAVTDMYSGGKEALAFQKRCKARGVPLEALKKVRVVQANRVVGEGSQFTRQMSLEFLLGIVGMLPQSGRDNLVADVIASRAGQFAVQRYFPRKHEDPKQKDQAAFAMVQIGAMKDGVPAIVTETQDHLLFAQLFLNASQEGMMSVGQGGNPAEVIRFVELAGTAIAQHLEMMRGDKSREQEVKLIEKQLGKLGKMVDQLKEQMMKQAQEQEQARQQQDRVMSEEERKNFQVAQEDRRRNVKVAQDSQRKNIKLSQQLAHAEAKAAQQARAQAMQTSQKVNGAK